jgi:signal recognition particle subunit SRP54
MVFHGLAEKLQETLKKLRGKGRLNEQDIKTALKEVKLALLEADVNYKVVKHFIAKIEERCIGHEVMQSLTPGQQVIKIVNDELTELMGSNRSDLNLSAEPPTTIMLVGLQGSGKTTSAGKLARNLKKQGKQPLLVACDIYRPAAIKQLQVLGERLEVPVFSMGDEKKPIDIAQGGINYACSHGNDIIILDTAGRLHINEEMMNELKAIKQGIKPDDILLVVDAMTGQDAVNLARSFEDILGIDGIIMTKLDGDARGGAALSIKSVTGKPIKYVGMGEKLDALEAFYPDRMASRILGMGDVLSLIEKAETSIDEQKARELEKKFMQNEFTLNDFLEQMQQVRKMGPLDQIMGMIPGLSGTNQLKNIQIDDKQLDHVEAIINSMTPEERLNPEIIKSSRRRRIASGSGRNIQEINRLLKQFKQTKKMMKQFSEMSRGKKRSKLPFF